MAYQSEAQLEEQLIEQLQNQNYNRVEIPDYDSLLENFKIQFEIFNSNKLNGTAITEKSGNVFLIISMVKAFLKVRKF